MDQLWDHDQSPPNNQYGASIVCSSYILESLGPVTLLCREIMVKVYFDDCVH